MGIPKMEADPCTGLDDFMADWKRSAFGLPLSERPKEAPLALVHDFTPEEAEAEDAGITRDDMTAEQRAESLAECAHNLMAEKRGLLARLEATNRELVRVLAANVPLQPLATYEFADMAVKGAAMLATINAAEALGHSVGVEFYRDDFTHRISGFTIGVRVAA